ncbi:hypothetical protein VIGAN_03157000 [Vigna angularis var. angularis]|uniref:Uncharacterized protein n=1 Tax=Vigna angularis var. angularis TaxID=157739 RepID=A0A0S3RMC8_PHAAN|nr:hypothetical protein VIGAN_03157000 [Vigna angularis var. angularis]
MTLLQQGNPDANKSPNLGMSHGIACVGEDNALAYSNPIKKKEDVDCSNHSKGLNIFGHEVGHDLDTKKVDNSKQKVEKATKRPLKKSSSSAHEYNYFPSNTAPNKPFIFQIHP